MTHDLIVVGKVLFVFALLAACFIVACLTAPDDCADELNLDDEDDEVEHCIRCDGLAGNGASGLCDACWNELVRGD